MKDDTALDEVIESNTALSDPVKFFQEHVDGCGMKSIPETSEGCVEFIAVDCARIITVKGSKTGLPIRYILP